MKKLISFSLLLMLPFCMMAQEFRVLSPDGLTYLNVKLADGRLTYNAGYRTVVKPKKKGAVADTLDVWVVRIGLQKGQFGYASAVGLIQGVVGLVLVVVTNHLAQKYAEVGLW